MKQVEVTEEWLYQVVPLVDRATLRSLESRVDDTYAFSGRFERRMRRMIRRVEHPLWFGFLRAAAALLLVTLLGAAGVLTFHPEARAAVNRWISYHDSFHQENYSFMDDAEPPETVPRYRIGWIPEGYDLYTDDYGGNWGNITYANKEETKYIALGYSLMGSTSVSFFDDQPKVEEDMTINGMEAKFFDFIGQEWTYLIWLDEAHDLVFTLGTSLGREDCIRVAESVYMEEQ